MERETVTVEEAAQLLPFSQTTIRRRAAELGGFKKKGCRRWLFKRSELLAKDGIKG